MASRTATAIPVSVPDSCSSPAGHNAASPAATGTRAPIVSCYPAGAVNDAVKLHHRCGMASEVPTGGQAEERQRTVSAEPDPTEAARTHASKLVDMSTGTGAGMEDPHGRSLAQQGSAGVSIPRFAPRPAQKRSSVTGPWWTAGGVSSNASWRILVTRTAPG